ncbi:MAG: 30S ribosomal protein S7 [Candidatus Magasanikbacteria bacterium]|jgi:small subunit ribosomal protein S7|nr:30S ribosomal protein S7 [Candidatus Magasanikbacteria bacterium]MBT4314671.1 30S ribosomal protein S7 [Candidatus Magasanikbacteria bacterium]MBT4547091.1 30S ribosomal protein S7 [Candidatus Magasanikbacteria bacterium]
MPRGRKIPKRVVSPDPKYNSLLVSRFINMIMKDGKKTLAQKIVYSALENLKEKIKKEDALKAFDDVMNAIRPSVEVRSRRVGGANYQVPMPVTSDRQDALAFRWIIAAARARKGRDMVDRLTSEMTDALEGVGGAFKKKEDTHRMAEANKAFAHFARRR